MAAFGELAREAELQARAEQLEQLLAAYIAELPPRHPLRHSGGGGAELTAHEFRALVEQEVGLLDARVLQTLCKALPPSGDPGRVDVHSWLARRSAPAHGPPPPGSAAAGGAAAGAARDAAAGADARRARAELLGALFLAVGSAIEGGGGGVRGFLPDDALAGPRLQQRRAVGATALRRRLEAEDTRGSGEVGVAKFVHVMEDFGMCNEESMALLRRATALHGGRLVPYRRWLAEHSPTPAASVVPKRAAKPSSVPSRHEPPAVPEQPPQAPSPPAPEAPDAHRREVWAFCRKLVLEAAADAIPLSAKERAAREAARRLQERFSLRPVVRATLTAERRPLQAFSEAVAQTFLICCSLSRLLFLERPCLVRQLDLLDGARLDPDPLHLARMAPFRSFPVLGFALDDALGRLLLLYEDWTLLLWSMHTTKPPGTSGPFGGPELACRRLAVDMEACRKARQSFNFRRYGELGLGLQLLTFLNAPAQCYCVNMSWCGQLVLLDPNSLVTLRVICLGGELAEIGTGVAAAGLWAMCEKARDASGASADAPIAPDLLAEYLGLMGVDQPSTVGNLFATTSSSGARLCDFREICAEIDLLRYPTPLFDFARRVVTDSDCEDRPSAMRSVCRALTARSAVDVLLDLQALPHRGLLLATSVGVATVWIIHLSSGKVVGTIAHQRSHSGGSAATSGATSAPGSSPLIFPPVLRVVATRDLVLTGGRTSDDACVCLWYLPRAPGVIPSAPTRTFRPSAGASGGGLSPVCGLDFLPFAQAVVDARANGKLLLWELTTFADDERNPTLEGVPEDTAVDTAPALVLQPQGGRLGRIVSVQVPHCWCAGHDLVVVQTRTPAGLQPAPLATSCSAGYGPSSISSWYVVRTRVRVPLQALSVPDLNAWLEPHVAAAAKQSLGTGLEETRSAVRSRLAQAADAGAAAARHAHKALLAGQMGLLPLTRLTWTPAAVPAKFKTAPLADPRLKGRQTPLTTGFDGGTLSLQDLRKIASGDIAVEAWCAAGNLHEDLQELCSRRFWVAAAACLGSADEATRRLVPAAIQKATEHMVVLAASVRAPPKPAAKAAAKPVMPARPAVVAAAGPTVVPDLSGMKWAGGKWLAKVLRERQRSIAVDAFGTALALPVPAAKAADGSKMLVPVGYRHHDAEAGGVFTSIMQSVALLPHLRVDDFVGMVRAILESSRCSLQTNPDLMADFKRIVAASTEHTEGKVRSALEELGLAPKSSAAFVDTVRSVGLGGEAALDFAAERLALAAGATAGAGSLRDAIGAVRGGAPFLAALVEEPNHDWRTDVMREDTAVLFLARVGVPVPKALREPILAIFAPAFRESPGVYSAARFLRLLYGSDEVAQMIVDKRSEIEADIRFLDTEGSGVVAFDKLSSALHVACGRRAVVRGALLRRCESDPAMVVYRELQDSMSTHSTGDEVLDFVVIVATQAIVSRLMSLFCGGQCAPDLAASGSVPSCSGEDLRSKFGWTGLAGVRLAKCPPRLFVRDMIDVSDIKVVVRCIAGLGISEESLSILARHIDPDGAGVVPCARVLRLVHERRRLRWEAAIAAVVEASKAPASAGGAGVDALADALASDAASDGSVRSEVFLRQAASALPSMPGDAWQSLVEAFAGASDERVDVPSLMSELRKLPGAQPPPPTVEASDVDPGVFPPLVSGELLQVLCGARDEIIQACAAADTAKFGTVTRGAFLHAVKEANIVMSEAEEMALGDFADARGDGQVPFRLVLKRAGAERASSSAAVAAARLAGGRRLVDAAAARPRDPAQVADFWRALAASLRHRGLRCCEAFAPPPAAAGDVITLRDFNDAIERLGLLTGGADGSFAAARPDILARDAFRELLAEAASTLVGPVAQRGGGVGVPLALIERNVARATEDGDLGDGTVELSLGRFVPDEVLASIRHETGLVAAIASATADLEAQGLQPFEAFARLDAGSGHGAVSAGDFERGFATLAPTVSAAQARRIFELMRGLPGGSRDLGEGLSDGITLAQFAAVFPARPEHLAATLEGALAEPLPMQVSDATWAESIADRLVAFLEGRGASTEQLFGALDETRRGSVSEAELVRAAGAMRLGISPGEAQIWFASVARTAGGDGQPLAGYREFVGGLAAAYARARAWERRRSAASAVAAGRSLVSAGRLRTPGAAMTGPELVAAVSKRLQESDPTLTQVFSRFAVDGVLRAASLPELLGHIGLTFSKAQTWLLWKELDVGNTGAIDEKTWVASFQVTASVDLEPSSIFCRLEAACTKRGCSLQARLADLDFDEVGWLAPAMARRIFAKMQLVASEREMDDWIRAVTEPGPDGGEPRIGVARAAALTAERAYGSRLGAARRFARRLRSAGIAAQHAWAIMRRCREDPSAPLRRADVVRALSALGLVGTASDLEQLLGLLDHSCEDAIQEETFLRVAEPDEAAARDALARRGIALPRGVPSAAQLRAIIAADGAGSPSEVDMLVLALTSAHGDGTYLRPLEVVRRVRAGAPHYMEPAAAQVRAQTFLLRLSNALGRDAWVLSTVMPVEPQLLSIMELNEALEPLGVAARSEDLHALQQVYPEDGLLAKSVTATGEQSCVLDAGRFLAVVERFFEEERRKKRPEVPEDRREEWKWLANKVRLRIVTSGLDLATTALVGKPVKRPPRSALREPSSNTPGRTVHTERLEEVLMAEPVGLTPEEASGLLHGYAADCVDPSGVVDVDGFLAALEPLPVREMDSRDLIWIERLHSQLRACFSGSEAAFDYLDAFGQGALDAAHFADGMLRLMSDGAQSYGLDTQGPRRLQVPAPASAESTLEAWSGRPQPKRFEPSAAHAARWDAEQREACRLACRRLFAGLTRPQRLGEERPLRLLLLSDLDRFWHVGADAAAVEAPIVVEPLWQAPAAMDGVGDFWAAGIAEIAEAQGKSLISLLPEATVGGLPGQVPGPELVAWALRMLALRFAPQFLSLDHRGAVFSGGKDPKELELHPECASLHVEDLAFRTILLDLRRHAERIVNCIVRRPLDMVCPLGRQAELTLSWAVDRSRFAAYCEGAKASTAGEGELLMGAPTGTSLEVAAKFATENQVYLQFFERMKNVVVAAQSIRPRTAMERYASLAAFKCVAQCTKHLQLLLADMQLPFFHSGLEQVCRSQLSVLGGDPATASDAPTFSDWDAARHVQEMEVLCLDDLRIQFDDNLQQRDELLDRPSFSATHPEVLWVTVESVERSGKQHRIDGAARFGGRQPRPIALRLKGDEAGGIQVAEVLKNDQLFPALKQDTWTLRRPQPPGRVEPFVASLQAGEVLRFQGPKATKVVAEVVPKAEVNEVTIGEAAIAVLLAGRTGQAFEMLLPTSEQRAARAVARATMPPFHGWLHCGDFVFVREPWLDDGWLPLSTAMATSGGFGPQWFAGGMYMFKIICRQILALLLLLRKHGVAARHLQLSDILISRDGLSLRLHRMRFAAFLGAGGALPPIEAASEDCLAPEFFAVGAATATTSPPVDVWVFGALAFYLFFGRPPPKFQAQLEAFLQAYDGLTWSGRLDQTPKNFQYTALLGVPPGYRVLLRAATDESSKLPGTPRSEVAYGPVLLAARSVSALAPKQAARPGLPAKGGLRAATGAAPAPPPPQPGLAVRLQDEIVDSEDDTKEKVVGEDNVVAHESHVLDFVFACLTMDPTRRPSLEQVFKSSAWDIESTEEETWHLRMLEPLLESLPQQWPQRAIPSKSSSLENALRSTCLRLIVRGGGLPAAHMKDFMIAFAEVEGMVLGASRPAAQTAMNANMLLYLNFVALRSREACPDLLQKFADFLMRLLLALKKPDAAIAAHADAVIDLAVGVLIGRELPVASPASWRTRFFLRPTSWGPRPENCDVVDEMWRHRGQERCHFDTQVYTIFTPHWKCLVAAAKEEGALSGLAAALKKRKVRGAVYVKALSEVVENHYRFLLANSTLGRRSAVQHSRRHLATGNLEQCLALADMQIPSTYLHLLGSSDEHALEEFLGFFEEAEHLFLPRGERCQAGMDCPTCGRFRAHHTARGVQLLSGLVLAPKMRLQVKMGAARLLLEVAASFTQPPQRQALSPLLQILQAHRPADDPVSSELQPYIRKLLTQALHVPSPPLVHALCCFPGALATIGVGRADAPRLLTTLGEVAEEARAWAARSRENAPLSKAKPPNWLAATPLLAWAQHLARLDNLGALQDAMAGLMEVYHEAGLRLELHCLPVPAQQGAEPADGVRQGDPGDEGAARFMLEYISLVEVLFARFGPAPAQAILPSFLKELEDPRLVETAWYLQVLRLFITLTGQKSPWLRPAATQDAKLRLQVAGIKALAATVPATDMLHPSKWNLGRWHTEFGKLRGGGCFVRALRAILNPGRVRLRRAQWTAKLFSLSREIWRNALGAPTEDWVKDMVEHGLVRFLLVDCFGPADAAGAGADFGGAFSAPTTAPAAAPAAAEPPQDEAKAEAESSAFLYEVRSAALALVLDAAQRGKQHKALVRAVVSLVNRSLIEEHIVVLLHSIVEEERNLSQLFLQVLMEFKDPDVELYFEQAGASSYVSAGNQAAFEKLGHFEGIGGIVPGDPVDDLGHPLALHRLQIGELVGSARVDVFSATAAAPAPSASPAPAAAPLPKPAGWKALRMTTTVASALAKAPASRPRPGVGSSEVIVSSRRPSTQRS